jgi:hypothetical protein
VAALWAQERLEHEGHEGWNLMNYPAELSDVQPRFIVFSALVYSSRPTSNVTYMKLAAVNRGLLINFKVKKLKEGLKRYLIVFFVIFVLFVAIEIWLLGIKVRLNRMNLKNQFFALRSLRSLRENMVFTK